MHARDAPRKKLFGSASSSASNHDPHRPSSPARRKLFFSQQLYKDERVYLDLPGYKDVDRLEADLLRLGAKVEKFLSPQVTCVVSHRPRGGASGAKTSATGVSSPLPNLGSRGRALLQISQNSQSPAQRCDVISNAQKWGIRIVPLSHVLEKVQNELRNFKTEKECCGSTKEQNVTRCLSGFYLKIEDESDLYKPEVIRFDEFPRVDVIPTGKKAPSGSTKQGTVDEGASKTAKSSHKTKRSNKAKEASTVKHKRGYCELCKVWYERLDFHSRSSTHKAYAENDENYCVLQETISKLPTLADFIVSLSSKTSDDCDSLLDAMLPTRCTSADDVQAEVSYKNEEGLHMPKCESRAALDPLVPKVPSPSLASPAPERNCDIQNVYSNHVPEESLEIDLKNSHEFLDDLLKQVSNVSSNSHAENETGLKCSQAPDCDMQTDIPAISTKYPEKLETRLETDLVDTQLYSDISEPDVGVPDPPLLDKIEIHDKLAAPDLSRNAPVVSKEDILKDYIVAEPIQKECCLDNVQQKQHLESVQPWNVPSAQLLENVILPEKYTQMMAYKPEAPIKGKSDSPINPDSAYDSLSTRNTTCDIGESTLSDIGGNDKLHPVRPGVCGNSNISVALDEDAQQVAPPITEKSKPATEPVQRNEVRSNETFSNPNNTLPDAPFSMFRKAHVGLTPHTVGSPTYINNPQTAKPTYPTSSTNVSSHYTSNATYSGFHPYMTTQQGYPVFPTNINNLQVGIPGYHEFPHYMNNQQTAKQAYPGFPTQIYNKQAPGTSYPGFSTSNYNQPTTGSLYQGNSANTKTQQTPGVTYQGHSRNSTGQHKDKVADPEIPGSTKSQHTTGATFAGFPKSTCGQQIYPGIPVNANYQPKAGTKLAANSGFPASVSNHRTTGSPHPGFPTYIDSHFSPKYAYPGFPVSSAKSNKHTDKPTYSGLRTSVSNHHRSASPLPGLAANVNSQQSPNPVYPGFVTNSSNSYNHTNKPISSGLPTSVSNHHRSASPLPGFSANVNSQQSPNLVYPGFSTNSSNCKNHTGKPIFSGLPTSVNNHHRSASPHPGFSVLVNSPNPTYLGFSTNSSNSGNHTDKPIYSGLPTNVNSHHRSASPHPGLSAHVKSHQSPSPVYPGYAAKSSNSDNRFTAKSTSSGYPTHVTNQTTVKSQDVGYPKSVQSRSVKPYHDNHVLVTPNVSYSAPPQEQALDLSKSTAGKIQSKSLSDNESEERSCRDKLALIINRVIDETPAEIPSKNATPGVGDKQNANSELIKLPDDQIAKGSIIQNVVMCDRYETSSGDAKTPAISTVNSIYCMNAEQNLNVGTGACAVDANHCDMEVSSQSTVTIMENTTLVPTKTSPEPPILTKEQDITNANTSPDMPTLEIFNANPEVSIREVEQYQSPPLAAPPSVLNISKDLSAANAHAEAERVDFDVDGVCSTERLQNCSMEESQMKDDISVLTSDLAECDDSFIDVCGSPENKPLVELKNNLLMSRTLSDSQIYGGNSTNNSDVPWTCTPPGERKVKLSRSCRTEVKPAVAEREWSVHRSGGCKLIFRCRNTYASEKRLICDDDSDDVPSDPEDETYVPKRPPKRRRLNFTNS